MQIVARLTENLHIKRGVLFALLLLICLTPMYEVKALSSSKTTSSTIYSICWEDIPMYISQPFERRVTSIYDDNFVSDAIEEVKLFSATPEPYNEYYDVSVVSMKVDIADSYYYLVTNNELILTNDNWVHSNKHYTGNPITNMLSGVSYDVIGTASVFFSENCSPQVITKTVTLTISNPYH